MTDAILTVAFLAFFCGALGFRLFDGRNDIQSGVDGAVFGGAAGAAIGISISLLIAAFGGAA